MAECWPLQMPPTPKGVLVSLADNANDQGYCWPTIETICERTCFGRTAVIDAIKWLEVNGLLIADRSNGRRTSYRITPGNYQKEAGEGGRETVEPVRETYRSGRRTGPGGGPNQSGRRTKPVREADTNRKEPSLTKSGGTRDTGTRLPADWTLPADWGAWAEREYPNVDANAEADRFADHWRSKAGKDGRKLCWQATWRNWIRRAGDFKPSIRNNPANNNSPAAMRPL